MKKLVQFPYVEINEKMRVLSNNTPNKFTRRVVLLTLIFVTSLISAVALFSEISYAQCLPRTGEHECLVESANCQAWGPDTLKYFTPEPDNNCNNGNGCGAFPGTYCYFTQECYYCPNQCADSCWDSSPVNIIKGFVYDCNGVPVSGVTVLATDILNSDTATDETDSNGYYHIDDLVDGPELYNVQVQSFPSRSACNIGGVNYVTTYAPTWKLGGIPVDGTHRMEWTFSNLDVGGGNWYGDTILGSSSYSYQRFGEFGNGCTGTWGQSQAEERCNFRYENNPRATVEFTGESLATRTKTINNGQSVSFTINADGDLEDPFALIPIDWAKLRVCTPGQDCNNSANYSEFLHCERPPLGGGGSPKYTCSGSYNNFTIAGDYKIAVTGKNGTGNFCSGYPGGQPGSNGECDSGVNDYLTVTVLAPPVNDPPTGTLSGNGSFTDISVNLNSVVAFALEANDVTASVETMWLHRCIDGPTAGNDCTNVTNWSAVQSFSCGGTTCTGTRNLTISSLSEHYFAIRALDDPNTGSPLVCEGRKRWVTSLPEPRCQSGSDAIRVTVIPPPNVPPTGTLDFTSDFIGQPARIVSPGTSVAFAGTLADSAGGTIANGAMKNCGANALCVAEGSGDTSTQISGSACTGNTACANFSGSKTFNTPYGDYKVLVRGVDNGGAICGGFPDYLPAGVTDCGTEDSVVVTVNQFPSATIDFTYPAIAVGDRTLMIAPISQGGTGFKTEVTASDNSVPVEFNKTRFCGGFNCTSSTQVASCDETNTANPDICEYNSVGTAAFDTPEDYWVFAQIKDPDTWWCSGYPNYVPPGDPPLIPAHAQCDPTGDNDWLKVIVNDTPYGQILAPDYTSRNFTVEAGTEINFSVQAWDTDQGARAVQYRLCENLTDAACLESSSSIVRTCSPLQGNPGEMKTCDYTAPGTLAPGNYTLVARIRDYAGDTNEVINEWCDGFPNADPTRPDCATHGIPANYDYIKFTVEKPPYARIGVNVGGVVNFDQRVWNVNLNETINFRAEAWEDEQDIDEIEIRRCTSGVNCSGSSSSVILNECLNNYNPGVYPNNPAVCPAAWTPTATGTYGVLVRAKDTGTGFWCDGYNNSSSGCAVLPIPFDTWDLLTINVTEELVNQVPTGTVDFCASTTGPCNIDPAIRTKTISPSAGEQVRVRATGNDAPGDGDTGLANVKIKYCDTANSDCSVPGNWLTAATETACGDSCTTTPTITFTADPTLTKTYEVIVTAKDNHPELALECHGNILPPPPWDTRCDAISNTYDFLTVTVLPTPNESPTGVIGLDDGTIPITNGGDYILQPGSYDFRAVGSDNDSGVSSVEIKRCNWTTTQCSIPAFWESVSTNGSCSGTTCFEETPITFPTPPGPPGTQHVWNVIVHTTDTNSPAGECHGSDIFGGARCDRTVGNEDVVVVRVEVPVTTQDLGGRTLVVNDECSEIEELTNANVASLSSRFESASGTVFGSWNGSAATYTIQDVPEELGAVCAQQSIAKIGDPTKAYQLRCINGSSVLLGSCSAAFTPSGTTGPIDLGYVESDLYASAWFLGDRGDVFAPIIAVNVPDVTTHTYDFLAPLTATNDDSTVFGNLINIFDDTKIAASGSYIEGFSDTMWPSDFSFEHPDWAISITDPAYFTGNNVLARIEPGKSYYASSSLFEQWQASCASACPYDPYGTTEGVAVIYLSGDLTISKRVSTTAVNQRYLLIVDGKVTFSPSVGGSVTPSSTPSFRMGIVAKDDIVFETYGGSPVDIRILVIAPFVSQGDIIIERDLGVGNLQQPAVMVSYDPLFIRSIGKVDGVGVSDVIWSVTEGN